MSDLVAHPFWRSGLLRWPAIWDEEDELLPVSGNGGLTVSEDESHVYIEAAVPGVDPKDVEITYDKGLLWIKAEAKTEEKGKKFYRKSASAFSYRVAVPGDIDTSVDPQAHGEHGVMKVTFTKSPKSQPKKISVK